MNELLAVKTYILTYPGLVTGSLLVSDHQGTSPVAYSIIPLPGPPWNAKYLDGASGERTFPFSFQTIVRTDAEVDRIANNGFFAAFADWLDAQTILRNFPVLNDDPPTTGAPVKNATKIYATSLPFLVQQGDSGIGLYQAQYALDYNQYQYSA